MDSTSCLDCPQGLCIHRVPLFSSLSRENLVRVAGLIQHKSFEKGAPLVAEGDRVEALTIINKGRVKAYRYTPEGREQILYLFSQGDFFGEQHLFGDYRATYSVEALESCRVCLLTKSRLEQVLFAHPRVAITLIAELGKRISQMENTFQSIGVRSLDVRIATLLLDFAAKYGEKTPEGTYVSLPISREGMANYLGVARETLSRKLSKLENESIVRSLDLKTLLVKESRLRDLAGLS